MVEDQMITAKINAQGETTLPGKVLDWLQLQPGDTVVFVRRGEAVVLKRVDDLLSLRGSVPVQGEQDFEAIRRKVLKKVAEQTANR